LVKETKEETPMIDSIPLPQLVDPLTILHSKEMGELRSLQILVTPPSSSINTPCKKK